MFIADHLNAFFKAPKKVDRANNNARGRSKTLAKKLGITIDIDKSANGNGYWLNNTGWSDETFCSDWCEVEDKLKLIASERS